MEVDTSTGVRRRKKKGDDRQLDNSSNNASQNVSGDNVSAGSSADSFNKVSPSNLKQISSYWLTRILLLRFIAFIYGRYEFYVWKFRFFAVQTCIFWAISWAFWGKNGCLFVTRSSTAQRQTNTYGWKPQKLVGNLTKPKPEELQESWVLD